MTPSKRVRFEVLRRDALRCRYCGHGAPDVPLTVDHVIPVALGGTDDPTNLVTACAECNAGKSSTSPDEHVVAQVSEDALRWAAAMKIAAERAAARRDTEGEILGRFRDQWRFPLPANWEAAVLSLLDSGLTLDDLSEATKATRAGRWIAKDEFSYFMGVAKRMLEQRNNDARRILTEGLV